MPPNKNQNLVMPFSENFLETWQLWKEYKKETFGFEYKGIFSEQMTLKKLVELSDGEEDKAVRIIEQSIMRQWQGLFPLHIPSSNGKSKQKQSSTENKSEKQSTGNLRERVSAAFNKRYGGGGQDANEPHLKAV